jgi:hypothetical protein
VKKVQIEVKSLISTKINWIYEKYLLLWQILLKFWFHIFFLDQMNLLKMYGTEDFKSCIPLTYTSWKITQCAVRRQRRSGRGFSQLPSTSTASPPQSGLASFWYVWMGKDIGECTRQIDIYETRMYEGGERYQRHWNWILFRIIRIRRNRQICSKMLKSSSLWLNQYYGIDLNLQFDGCNEAKGSAQVG